jgi:hypothetical protein
MTPSSPLISGTFSPWTFLLSLIPLYLLHTVSTQDFHQNFLQSGYDLDIFTGQSTPGRTTIFHGGNQRWEAR